MGRLFLQKLEGRCYACVYCGCHLANSCDLLSRVLAFPSASSHGMVFPQGGIWLTAWVPIAARHKQRLAWLFTDSTSVLERACELARVVLGAPSHVGELMPSHRHLPVLLGYVCAALAVGTIWRCVASPGLCAQPKGLADSCMRIKCS